LQQKAGGGAQFSAAKAAVRHGLQRARPLFPDAGANTATRAALGHGAVIGLNGFHNAEKEARKAAAHRYVAIWRESYSKLPYHAHEIAA
jgi:hypothetical protein